ncbi:glutamate 5-kinase [Bacillus sp. HMF5848]|uniref:glutamate 5-kinase n=1 Tax=Bacillus sp. HMF5848 TaxID=2495421 RepID=UPI000F77F7AE|nr:glutamate 5-kinase [Bacillus sp. HMF5848]RSK27209.1 glutamate 5-kinase [Bacillus sp. HMF5848]
MAKQRIVVKIGSSSLTNTKGNIDETKLTDHISALAKLKQSGHEVLLVSSGAVAAGFTQLGYPIRPTTIKGRQAAAAVGQGLLIQTYMELFKAYDIIAAQILLTRDDFANRIRYKNAYATLTELLDRGILPIINENDTVAVEELTFGDNDMLSALVSGLIHADQLIILTDINGLYNRDPRKYSDAERLNIVELITDEMIAQAASSGSSVGTGGMKSKLLAAKTALSLGVPVFIGRGEGSNKLTNIIAGYGDGTYCCKTEKALNTVKQWIHLHSEAIGAIYIDEGAEKALILNGKSLLLAGVNKVVGHFESGAVVKVFCYNNLLGKGEVSYSSEDLLRFINEHPRLKLKHEVIHRNKWVQAERSGKYHE